MQPCFYLDLFVLLLCAGVSLGSAGLGHRIVFLACVLVFFTPCVFIFNLYFALALVDFKTCIIFLAVSIAHFCMFSYLLINVSSL